MPMPMGLGRGPPAGLAPLQPDELGVVQLYAHAGTAAVRRRRVLCNASSGESQPDTQCMERKSPAIVRAEGLRCARHASSKTGSRGANRQSRRQPRRSRSWSEPAVVLPAAARAARRR